MKKSILTTAAVVLLSVMTFGSTSNFENLMKSNLEIVRAGDETTDFRNLGYDFAKIAKNNKNRFEPLYYSAYCFIISSWQISDADQKQKVLGKAIKQIRKAKELAANNDELFVLEALYYQAIIMINPVEYGQKYSMKAEQLLLSAQAINKDNPRAEFLRAQNLYYRPVQFGGGKGKALPLFERAAELFKKQNTDNYLQAVWGSSTNSEMIKICTGKKSSKG